ncbi:MAG TPA: hypothetical protein VK178_09305 [Opitutaceae bacterium]|nr:hypothetical protein [Opitutaceae bacterium]
MKLRLLAPLLLLLATHGFAQDPTAGPDPDAAPQAGQAKLLGSIEEGRYHAPDDAFSVAVPVLHGEKTAIMDNGEIVVFKDKVATLLTIAAFRMPPIAKWEHETTEPREYLITFFRDNILRDYDREFPGSKIESARFLPGFQGGALVAFALLPGGSAFEPAANRPPTAPPPVAKRGHLVFVRDDRVFVVAIELAERVTGGDAYKLTAPEEDRVLFDRLITVLAATRFGPDETLSGITSPEAN